jgi:hypothetical protein
MIGSDLTIVNPLALIIIYNILISNLQVFTSTGLVDRPAEPTSYRPEDGSNATGWFSGGENLLYF